MLKINKTFFTKESFRRFESEKWYSDQFSLFNKEYKKIILPDLTTQKDENFNDRVNRILPSNNDIKEILKDDFFDNAKYTFSLNIPTITFNDNTLQLKYYNCIAELLLNDDNLKIYQSNKYEKQPIFVKDGNEFIAVFMPFNR